jgi:hypothetical protein
MVLQGRAQFLGTTTQREITRQLANPFIPPMTGDLTEFPRKVALAVSARAGLQNDLTRMALEEGTGPNRLAKTMPGILDLLKKPRSAATPQ